MLLSNITHLATGYYYQSCVKLAKTILNKHGLALFGFYRLALGAVLIVLLMQGSLTVRQEGDAAAPTKQTTAPKMTTVKTPIP